MRERPAAGGAASISPLLITPFSLPSQGTMAFRWGGSRPAAQYWDMVCQEMPKSPTLPSLHGRAAAHSTLS